ncbi:MAG: CPBP family intramembrane metalloprotease [Pirellulales bacterium]|nr:CPBP family intramembrane metalloprotease [Pirellulales bacterium]
MQSLIFFGAIFVALPWWFVVSSALRRHTPVFPHTAKWESQFDLLDVIIIIFASVLLPSFFLLPKLILVSGSNPDLQITSGSMLLVSATSSVGVLIGTILAACSMLLRHGSLSSVRLTPMPLMTLIGISLVAIVLFIPLTYIANGIVSLLVPYSHPLLESLSTQRSTFSLWLAVFSAVIVAPISEEFMFRGVLFGFFQRIERYFTTRIGTPLVSNGIFSRSTRNLPYFAILASGLIFGLLHWGHGAAWIPLSLLGMALAYLTHRTGNLLPAIAVHMTLNGFSTVIQFTV